MAATASTMLPLGTKMPSFTLTDPATGNTVGSDSFRGLPAVVVAFICNHCPFVHHIREELAAFGRECRGMGVAVVAINSNDVEKYPDDAPEKMVEEAEAQGYTFPYLFDSTQEVAKKFHAACTPDFFVFDREMKLAYRGQFDETRPKSGKSATGQDLRAAVRAIASGAAAPAEQTPSMGCNIKWKPGNEPAYFSA
ncbi:MAG: thioredoxin family protein [Planctomycetota bacterium]|nr:thioredoxin family protein [Planctomycetota bacterium]